MNKVKLVWSKIHISFKIILAACTLITTIVGTTLALDGIGIRPVVNMELEDTNVRIAGLELNRLDTLLLQAQRELYQVQREREKIKEPTPIILNRELELNNEISRIERSIKEKEKETK